MTPKPFPRKPAHLQSPDSFRSREVAPGRAERKNAKKSTLHPSRREAWSFQPVGVLCALGSLTSGVGCKRIPDDEQGCGQGQRMPKLIWVPLCTPCACRFLLGGGSRWTPFKLITLCSGEQSGNRRRPRGNPRARTHTHTHCSASTMLLSLLPAGGRPAPGTAFAGSPPSQKLPGSSAQEAGSSRGWRLARRREGRREGAAEEGPRGRSALQLSVGARRRWSQAGAAPRVCCPASPARGGRIPQLLLRDRSPGRCREQGADFLPVGPQQASRSSSRHSCALGTYFAGRHDSAELVLLLRDPLGQVPLLLPPAPAPLPSQPGNASSGPFQPSSRLPLSLLSLMDYLSLSGTHHRGLVSLALMTVGNPGGVPSPC